MDHYRQALEVILTILEDPNKLSQRKREEIELVTRAALAKLTKEQLLAVVRVLLGEDDKGVISFLTFNLP